MGKIDKLIKKLKSDPKDFTWSELVKILAHFGYYEVANKGKSGGSRRKFSNKENKIISLHEPHPDKTIKRYVIRRIIDHLDL